MTYKKQLICLVSIIFILLFAYIGSFIYNIDFKKTSSLYSWLDFSDAEKASRIIFYTEWEEFEFNKRNDYWFITHNGNEYPARQQRMSDFFNILTTRSSWPVRSSTESSHERFDLDEFASRITIYDDNSAVILDLMIGKDDVMGTEAYFLKVGQNDVRSGDNTIKAYMTNAITGWYNFRIIPETESNNIDSVFIQRVYVHHGEETQVFSRNYYEWNIFGINVSLPDVNSIENYIRTILNTEGDNFIHNISTNDPVFNQNRIVLEFGDGEVLTIRISDPEENGRRFVNISGREHIYSVPAWASNRFFRDASSFELTF
ncbi:MAG: hypothetical protein FWD13_00365 [Treponema sp.]|nr:hypothetical protein [Treponema sp.]